MANFMGLVLHSPIERIEQMIVLTKAQREFLFQAIPP
jgi:hypothetical protein